MASLVRTALAKRIIKMAHRPGVDVQKLRDDAIAYVKNNPIAVTLECPKFELIINAQIARMLGLTVPDKLLAAAEEAID
jgi:hypothetical protein